MLPLCRIQAASWDIPMPMPRSTMHAEQMMLVRFSRCCSFLPLTNTDHAQLSSVQHPCQDHVHDKWTAEQYHLYSSATPPRACHTHVSKSCAQSPNKTHPLTATVQSLATPTQRYKQLFLYRPRPCGSQRHSTHTVTASQRRVRSTVKPQGLSHATCG